MNQIFLWKKKLSEIDVSKKEAEDILHDFHQAMYVLLKYILWIIDIYKISASSEHYDDVQIFLPTSYISSSEVNFEDIAAIL